MKRELTVITRGVIYLMGVAVVTVCGILLPEVGREEARANPNAGPIVPFLIAAWILSIPIFIALNQALKLLGYIEEKNAFSNRSVTALRNIKICALVFSVMIAVSAIALVIVGSIYYPTEDRPPIVLFGGILTFTSLIIATFVGILQRLLQDAIKMKSENDLTV